MLHISTSLSSASASTESISVHSAHSKSIRMRLLTTVKKVWAHGFNKSAADSKQDNSSMDNNSDSSDSSDNSDISDISSLVSYASSPCFYSTDISAFTSNSTLCASLSADGTADETGSTSISDASSFCTFASSPCVW